MAGATGVAVGTANFFNPYATQEVVEGVEEFMIKQGIKDISEIRGIID
jgi:dihydroorotate dehydrogenase (NAD+) catalytic subunit